MKSVSITMLLILVALLNACDSKPSIGRLTGESTVVAFGDSLTSGFGVTKNESYPTVLADLLGCRVVNAGVSGEDTFAGLQRLPAVLKTNKPDLVILCMGGNDMLQKQSKEKMKANLKSMIQLIQNSEAAIIMIGVPEPGLLLKTPGLYGELEKSMICPSIQRHYQQ